MPLWGQGEVNQSPVLTEPRSKVKFHVFALLLVIVQVKASLQVSWRLAIKVLFPAASPSSPLGDAGSLGLLSLPGQAHLLPQFPAMTLLSATSTKSRHCGIPPLVACPHLRHCLEDNENRGGGK